MVGVSRSLEYISNSVVVWYSLQIKLVLVSELQWSFGLCGGRLLPVLHVGRSTRIPFSRVTVTEAGNVLASATMIWYSYEMKAVNE